MALERCRLRRGIALHNFSNLSSTAFKRVDPWTLTRDFTQGSFRQTGNQLNLAIEGNGLFQVVLPDGSMAYMRSGAFELDSRGSIVTHEGYLLEPQITVPVTSVNLEINSYGIVIAQDPTGSLNQLGTIQLAQFISAPGLQALGIDLFRETAASGSPTVSNPGVAGSGLLRQGFLESSNVREAEESFTLEQLKREDSCIRWALEHFGYRIP